MPRNALFADSNPHLINFYKAIATGKLDGLKVRSFLEREGEILSQRGKDYYLGVTQLDLRGKWVERDKHAQRL